MNMSAMNDLGAEIEFSNNEAGMRSKLFRCLLLLIFLFVSLPFEASACSGVKTTFIIAPTHVKKEYVCESFQEANQACIDEVVRLGYSQISPPICPLGSNVDSFTETGGLRQDGFHGTSDHFTNNLYYYPKQYFIEVPPLPESADDGASCPNNCIGPKDPINPSNGNEYLIEPDLVSGDLSFKRIYNGRNINALDMGPSWRHSYSRHLKFLPLSSAPTSSAPTATTSGLYLSASDACTSGWESIKGNHPLLQHMSATYANKRCLLSSAGGGEIREVPVRNNVSAYITLPRSQKIVYAVRDDGRIESFVDFGAKISTALGIRQSLKATPSGYEFRDENDNVEAYDASGKLMQITGRDGAVTTFNYTAGGALSAAVDRQGRSLTLNYGTDGRLSTVAASDGRTVGYIYDAAGRLTKITYPDNKTQQLFHNSTVWPTGITSLVDENNVEHLSWTYDNQGRVLLAKLSGPQTSLAFQYHADGSTTETDARGVVRTFSFKRIDTHKVNVSVSGPPCDGCTYNQTTTFDGAGHRSSLTDYKGNVTSYVNEPGRGLQTQRIDAANDTTGHKRTTQTDWHSEYRVPLQRRTYDANNVLVAKTSWTYNARGQALTITQTDPVTSANRTTTVTYCEQADITAGTCPLLGLVKSVNGPRTDANDITTYTYRMADAPDCATSPAACAYRKGDLWKVTNALGQVSELLSYDGAGRAKSVKSAAGITTDVEFDARGRVIASKVRGADNAVETDDQINRIEYWPTGLVKKVIQQDGVSTQYTYDSAQRLTGIADSEGNSIAYTLDAGDERTKEEVKDANGTLRRTLSRTYNNLGRLQAVTDAYGRNTGFTYDANGNPDLSTDALSRSADSNFDPLDRLVRSLQDVSGIAAETKFTYDANDNLTKVADPKGLNTTYAYNAFGEVTQLVSPDTGTTNYSYDSAGNRIGQTDARGMQTQYAYDALNRVTSVSYPQDATLNVGRVYDVAQADCTADESFLTGLLSKMTDGSGSTTYCYNRFGQLTRKVQRTQGKTFTQRWQYATNGRLLSAITPGGAQLDYVYDAHGRVIEIGVISEGQPRKHVVSNVLYHPFGGPARWASSENRIVVRTQNLNGQPGIVQAQNLSGTQIDGISLGYDFDEVGNLKRLRNGDQADPPARVFGYDGLNRLTEAKDAANTVWQSYSYDKTGNRQTAGWRTLQLNEDCPASGGPCTPLPPTTQWQASSYTYGASNHRLLAMGTRQRSYDTAGNLLLDEPLGVVVIDPPPGGGETESAAYEGTLQSAADGSDSDPAPANGDQARSFSYNAANRMSAVALAGVHQMSYRYNGAGERVFRQGGGKTVHTVFDPAGHWVGDYDVNGNAIQEAIWFGDLPVGLLAKIANNTRLFHIEADALGTPRTVVDSTRGTTGTVVWRWDLSGEAFGNDKPNEDPDGDGTAFVFDMRFPGQQYDSASGLNYNYFRDYEATTGRYVESDPIGLNGGISTYSYVASNPIVAFDPVGLSTLNSLDANGGMINVPRDEFEKYISSRPLTKKQKINLDRGCIGLASVYQGLDQDFPEDAPKTKCFLGKALAIASAMKCRGNPFVFGKQGSWLNGAPSPDANGRVPNNSISSGGGMYNYVTYFTDTKNYAWMNHSTAYPDQRGYVYRLPPKDLLHYPNEIWCTTCK